MSADQIPNPMQLVLPEALDTAAAAELLDALTAARGQPLVLAASGARRIGGQCLQVLLAARNAWAADQQELRFADPSQDFLDGLALMGCSDLVDLTPVQD
jgi:chemotaxis protein CheX